MGSWEVIENSPYGVRDNHFIDPGRGWGVTAGGILWHTPDGGETWIDRWVDLDVYLRSVGMTGDGQRGWVGTLDSTVPLLHTYAVIWNECGEAPEGDMTRWSRSRRSARAGACPPVPWRRRDDLAVLVEVEAILGERRTRIE